MTDAVTTTKQGRSRDRGRSGGHKLPGTPRGEITDRRCLCCNKLFKSESKFNRLCCYCKDVYSSSMG